MKKDDFEAIEVLFIDNTNHSKKEQMEAYMKNRYTYLGITAPQRKELMKSIFQGIKWNRKDIVDFSKFCWASKYRELKYAAMDILHKHSKKLELQDLEFLEQLILADSWWDTVDSLAVNPVGELLSRDFKVRKHWVQKWANSNDMWLRRTAILHQLKYKDKVHTALLEETITKANGTKEFFLNKAIGWMLRQYSRTNPSYVIEFCEVNELSNLSRREALRLLK